MKLIGKDNLWLKKIEKSDFNTLYTWRNDTVFLDNCSYRNKVRNKKEFIAELEIDFETDRHLQAIIFKIEEPIGTIFSYNYNADDKYCFVTTFVHGERKSLGYGLKAFILFCKYHFDNFKLFKIYADVYEFNKNSLNLFLKKKIPLEGVFKQQKVFKNKRYDVYRFALYIEHIDELLKYV